MEENKEYAYEDGKFQDEKLEAAVKAKVAELKKADSKLKTVFPIIVFGSEYDDKEFYIAYFKQPSFSVFSKFLAASQANQAVAMRELAKECFVDGDKELINDDSLFLFGLMGQLSKIISLRQGALINL